MITTTLGQQASDKQTRVREDAPMKHWITALTALTLTLGGALPAWAGKAGSLDECLKLRKSIDTFSELRRQGGTAEDMDGWKRARDEAQQAFRDLRCRRHGRKVR
jgi:hypothetical protein